MGYQLQRQHKQVFLTQCIILHIPVFMIMVVSLLFTQANAEQSHTVLKLQSTESFKRHIPDPSFINGNLVVSPSNWITIKIPQGESIYGCNTELSIQPLKQNSSFNPTAYSNGSSAVFKVKFGRIVIEIGSNNSRIVMLDSLHATIDTILAQFSCLPTNGPDNYEIGINDRVLTLVQNREKIIETPIHDGIYFDVIDLKSNDHPYLVSFLEVKSVIKDTIHVNKPARTVEIATQYFPDAFNSPHGLRNHHLLAFNTSASAPHALFTAFCDAQQLIKALQEIGFNSANVLSKESWEGLSDPLSKGPRKKATGEKISVELKFQEHNIQLGELISDKNGQSPDFRFTGNRDLVRYFNSGCMICLASCPGGAISNARYSLGEWSVGKAQFNTHSASLRRGDVVIMRLRKHQ